MIEDAPTPSQRVRSREEVADYLLDIGATLASYGCPSYRLEDVMRLVADVEGFHAEPFALPTGLFLRVVPKDAEGPFPEVHRMARLSERGVDLDRLTLVDEIFNDVVARRSTIEQARARIRKISKKPPTWSPALVWAASTALSGAAAVFFRGTLVDVLVAAIVGGVIAGSRALLAHPAQRLLSDFLGGMFAAMCAWLATRVWPTSSPEVVVLAGAIAMFPGMTFTTGLAEVAQKNLVSGGARLMDAAVTLLLILFGVALVAGLQKMMHVDLPTPDPKREGLGLPYQAAALLVSSGAFGIVFQIPRRYLWAALVSGSVGYVVTALAVRSLPEHVAAFCAALAVCTVANLLARITDRPAQLFQLPGMVLLVPGSFGFVSLGKFLANEAEAGTQMAFTMALVGAALVIGVLVANVVMPARKLL
ncbi:MAG: threonine/serine exporter family protein [Deltaproteobacteria bacterium]|nr:threonine/serine exporter family protein [Deltaproteobacteria bacterium]